MSVIKIQPITIENKAALKLPNDPFQNTGRMIPMYDGHNWTYEIDNYPLENITEDCFPDENYVYEEMGDDFHGLAAYMDEECVGYAILRTEWNKFLYLDNLLVVGKFRRQGVATALVNEAMQLARDLGKIGLHLVCQDNNLQAMYFYLSMGFEIGGLDTKTYTGTNQANKADIHLYKE